MANCQRYIQGLCISLNILLLVFGVVMMGVGFCSGYRPTVELDQWTTSNGQLLLRIFGPVTVVISILGVCAATINIKPVLLVYSALMFVVFVALMVVTSPLIHIQTQMDGVMEKMFQNVTPLFRAETEFQNKLNKVQTSYSCCGLKNYTDWEVELPPSCICPSQLLLLSSPSPSLPSSSHTSTSCQLVGRQRSEMWVHSKPCGPIMKDHNHFLIRVIVGVISAFATVTMAAMFLSLVLGLEERWRKKPVEMMVDDFDRVKYQPKPSTN